MFREISVELSLCSELAPFPDACVAAFEEREHDWLSPLLLTIGTTQAETAFLVAIAVRIQALRSASLEIRELPIIILALARKLTA